MANVTIQDNSYAIQQAIDHVEASGGGEVVIGAGNFILPDTLRFCGNNTNIRGAGRTTTNLIYEGSGYAFYFENDDQSDAKIYYNRVSDLTINLTDNNAVGFVFERAIEPVMERVIIKGNNDHENGSQTAIIFDGEGDSAPNWGGGLRLERSRIHGVKTGIKVLKQAGTCHIISNWILGCSTRQSGSVAIDLSSPDGLGMNMIHANEIETWDVGISDQQSGNVYIGNRFEAITTPIKHSKYGIGRFQSIGNVMEAGCGPSEYGVYGYALDTYQTQFGSHLEGQPDLRIMGSDNDQGPQIGLYHLNQDSNTPVLRLKAVGAGEVDDFGDAGPAVAISVPVDNGATDLRIGTILSGNIVLETSGIQQWQVNNDLKALNNELQGLVLISPNGTRWKARVNDDGTWNMAAL